LSYPSKSFSDQTKLEVYSFDTIGFLENQEFEFPPLKLKETLKTQEKIVDVQKPTNQAESELILCKLDSDAGFSVRYFYHGTELKRYFGKAASLSSMSCVLNVSENGKTVSLTSCLGCTQNKEEKYLGHSDAIKFIHCDEESKDKGKGSTGNLISCASDKTTRIWSIAKPKDVKNFLIQPTSPATSPMISVVILTGNTEDFILTLSKNGILSLWTLDSDGSKIIDVENLDPEFKDTFNSLSVSKCSNGEATFEKKFNLQEGYLIATTCMISGICTWSLQIISSRSHFNLQKLSNITTKGIYDGQPLCSYLEPKNSKGLIIGFDNGNRSCIGKDLIKGEGIGENLRVTSIAINPYICTLACFPTDRNLPLEPWAKVSFSLQHGDGGLSCLGDIQGQLHIIDYQDKNVILKQKVHNCSITGLAEMDGKLVTASMDGTIKLWNVPENLTSAAPNTCKLTQVGEFSTASKAPLTCLTAISMDKLSNFKESPMETNEVITNMSKNARKRKGENRKKSLNKKLCTSGIIVAGDIAGGVYIIHAKKLST